MRLLLLLYSLLASTVAPPDDPAHRLWAERVRACLGSGVVEVLAADEAAGVLAFSCGTGDRRLVVMANGSEVPQRVRREDPEPLVPVFATRGDVAAIPSLLITLFEAGGVAYSNEVPPRTAVVFRPAAPGDVRPHGLEE
jgi:cyclomaltodextrinase / maltogenic alpha-amylase / neopullulanase